MWQPIETAPKNETDILVRDKDGICAVVFWEPFDYIDKKGSWEIRREVVHGYEWEVVIEPVEWMPVPS